MTGGIFPMAARFGPRLTVAILPVALGGCLARSEMPVHRYLIEANYGELPDCVYRAIQDNRSIILAQPEITRLQNPPETRVALIPAGGIMDFEVAFRPDGHSGTVIESRERGNIWGEWPDWKLYIKPAISACTAAKPELAQKP